MSTTTLVEPACAWEPPGRVGSFRDDVGEVAERLGRPLMPEQLLAADLLTAYDRRGRFLSVEAGIEMPRQNGKTAGVLLPIILWSCLTEADEYLWTAHLLKTSSAAFFDLAGRDENDEKGLINTCDWLRRRVRSRSWGNDAAGKSIDFVNGAHLGFHARSGRAGRGLSGSVVVIDEALFWDTDAAGALLPVLATRSLHGNARAYYASSAPKKESAYLRGLRRRAIEHDPTLSWIGWWARGALADPGCLLEDCAHAVDTPGCSLDDEVRWAEANPMLGRLTSIEFLRGQRRSLRDDPVEFAREYMGWGEISLDAVDLDRWGALADPHSKPLPRPLGLGWAVSPGGKSAAVVAVGRRADGMLHVELLAHETGTAWLGPWLRAKQGELDVQVWHRAGKVPEAAAVRGLRDAGVTRLREVPVAGYAVACDSLDRAVNGRTLRHLGDPRLAVALGSVVRRDVGDGLWEMTWRGSQGDCAPAMAMIPALHGLLQYPAAGQSANFG